MSEAMRVVSEPWVFEGRALCPGCEEIFVATGMYCADCVAVEELLDRRWRTSAARPGPVKRVECGIVPAPPIALEADFAGHACDAIERMRPVVARCFGFLLGLGLLASAGLALAFTWFAGRGLVRLGFWMAAAR